ncbi:MAG TPA: hypothetical protein VFS21_16635 [Roseiflexaceae bacterium]|nr:hypothetical protein [Roseiflexaceae bacterium]
MTDELRTYRVFYLRYSPQVSLGSREALRLYQAGVRWNPVPDREFAFPIDPPFLFSIARLDETHALVYELKAPSLGAVYGRMQIEHAPEHIFEAIQRKIEELDLTHSTMTAGDVIQDVEAGIYWECEIMGWRQLE